MPAHVARAAVSYRHAGGFYVTPRVDIAGATYVDFANTLKNDSHVIAGLRAGFDHPHGWSLFVEAENLTDRKYASNVAVVADAGSGSPAVFNPGRPRAVFAGVEFAY